MKRIYPFFAALLLILCGCGQKQTETSDTKETVSAQSANEASPESSMPESSRAEQNTNGISYQVKNAETPKAETASMEEPLSLGQWGTAAKYCTKDGSYCDIPVSILSVRRGNDVTKEAMALAKKRGGGNPPPLFCKCFNDLVNKFLMWICDLTSHFINLVWELD